MVQACALQILNLLQKHLSKVKRDFGVLQIDYSKIGDIMENGTKNAQTDNLVPIMASGILAEVVAKDNQSSLSLLDRFMQPAAMGILSQLVDLNKQKSDIKRIDGTNFGCPFLGILDYPYKLLANIIMKGAKKNP